MPSNVEMARLSMIFNACSASKNCLVPWLEIPEFKRALIDALNAHVYLNDQSILSIMERLWPDMDSGKIVCPSFKNCKRAMNQLRRAVEEQSKLPVT